LRIPSACEKKDLSKGCFVRLLAGWIAMLLTITADGFVQFMGQYTLFVGYAQMPAILLNS
jgi:hypothetical protein